MPSSPRLPRGLLNCQLGGYALCRCSTRTTRRRLTPIIDGRAPRPIDPRKAAAVSIVQSGKTWWRRSSGSRSSSCSANPALVRAEIDRRLTELRADHVGGVQRDVATKELARIRAGIARLIEAYQEQLMSPDELRTRMPSLRQRGTDGPGPARDSGSRAPRRRDVGGTRRQPRWFSRQSPSRARLNQSSSGALNSAPRPPSDPRFVYCVQGIVNTQIGAT